MGQASRVLRSISPAGYSFWCPGCQDVHAVTVGAGGWGFNGDLDKPTFTPSVLVTSGHFSNGNQGDCWCTFEERTGRAPGFRCYRCHSFVTDGEIRFLSDCTHALAGQSVVLPDLPDWLKD